MSVIFGWIVADVNADYLMVQKYHIKLGKKKKRVAYTAYAFVLMRVTRFVKIVDLIYRFFGVFLYGLTFRFTHQVIYVIHLYHFVF